MTVKADSRLAEFLRRVRAGDDDVAPVDVIFGDGVSATEVLQSMADQFASSVREMGYIEPAAGSEDLRRVRLTPQGRDWLDEYDQRDKTLHPRFSS